MRKINNNPSKFRDRYRWSGVYMPFLLAENNLRSFAVIFKLLLKKKHHVTLNSVVIDEAWDDENDSNIEK